MGIISDEAKAIFLSKIKGFRIPEDEIEKRSQMRKEFLSSFTTEKIKNLTSDLYFPGLGGKKGDCLGYQLEWGTIPLGSIKGGSIAKYGPKEQFAEIKNLLIELTVQSDEASLFYESNGNLTKLSNKLVADSLKIRGMKSGRTVLCKLLSIYYHETFIALFNDQDYLLENIIKEYSNDSSGLESFLKNNYLLLKIKEELLAEPAFNKEIKAEKFSNDIFYRFLYECFPFKKEEYGTEKKEQEELIEALETQHYQKLIHRNFTKLFRGLHYYDEEMQNSHEGHFDTGDAGIMDFLCLDESNNFVVIELKRKGTDETLAQLCRYMGWVKENIVRKGQNITGLIVSESKDIKLEYAMKVVPNVTLKQMKLNVSIENFEK